MGRVSCPVPRGCAPHCSSSTTKLRGAEIADRDVHDAVRDVEVPNDLLLDAQHELVLVPRVLGPREAEHLDLVELVHPEHAAHVLAVRAARTRS